MVRTVKSPDIRRAEILKAANSLFNSRGYASTSVDEIVRTVGVAKGTFYYYFKSKEEVLAALAQQLAVDMAERSQAIANDPEMGAIEKICTIISEQNRMADSEQSVVENLHRPENREMHERSNVETVLVFGPILASVIEQGNREGVFQVEDPLSTIQFILAGSLFLLGHGIFNWSAEQEAARTQAMLILIERALGAATGSFAEALGHSLQSKD